MSYRSEIEPSVRRKILSWRLTDYLLVEVNLRLFQSFRQNPLANLERVRVPFDGMVHRFALMDPDNRFCEHHFTFHIMYGQDEQSLAIIDGHYVRLFGT